MSTNLRKSMITDSDDSTEDLILKEDASLSPNGMLSTEPYLNYVVEVPQTAANKKLNNLTKKLLAVIIILVIICVIFACLYFHEKSTSNSTTQAPSYCTSAGCVQASAFIKASMDESIDPCDDFYLYSCAGWLSNNPIPDGKTQWSIDTVLNDRNDIVMKTILQNITAKQSNVDSVAEYKSFQLFRSCMDINQINKLGVTPLKNIIDRLGGFSSLQNGEKGSDKDKLWKHIVNLLAYAHTATIFSVHIGADDKHSDKNILKVKQPFLDLPEYLYEKNDTDIIPKTYVAYLTAVGSRICPNCSIKELNKYANETYEFQKSLKQIIVPEEKRITVEDIYHLRTLNELNQLVPNIDFLRYAQALFNKIGIDVNGSEPVVVESLEYFEKLSDLLNNTDLRVIINHGIFKVATSYASFLTEDISLLRKNLSLAVNGAYKELPRWKRCVRSTDAGMGFALGAMFVKKAFARQSNIEANNMVIRVRNAFIELIQSLDWMDIRTKEAAKEKGEAIYQKIGYPSFILNPTKLDEHYKKLENLTEHEYFENELKIFKYQHEAYLKRLRQPVDPTEWFMTPPTVNAYYDPSTNQIVFPAGILQPPYFKAEYPKSVNFGSMGAIIGHEITHGFDNNGRLYDKKGNYHGNKSWWTQSSVDGFKNREKCFIDQYSKAKVEKLEIHIKGNVTLGENIADNGGLKASYKAYKNWIKEFGEEPLLPGLSKTNDQVFFIAFAQSWCTGELRSRLINQIETDVHSPPIERVRGSVENNEDFARAFNCPLKSNMNPERKCGIW